MNLHKITLFLGVLLLAISAQPVHCMIKSRSENIQQIYYDTDKQTLFQRISLSFCTGEKLNLFQPTTDEEVSIFDEPIKKESVEICTLSRIFWTQFINTDDILCAKKYTLLRVDKEALYLECDSKKIKLFHGKPSDQHIEYTVFGERYTTSEWSELIGKTYFAIKKATSTRETPVSLQLKVIKSEKSNEKQ